MRTLAIGVSINLLLLWMGCFAYSGEPEFIGRRIEWFEKTDPQRFFDKERKRGLIYFISFYDSKLGAEGPVPGISKNDPQFDISRTWFVPTYPNYLNKNDLALDTQYREAVKRFAEKYNPLVLEYLKTTKTTPAPMQE